MFVSLPLNLFALLVASFLPPTNGLRFFPSFSSESVQRRSTPSSGINFNPNGSAFLWLPEDTYAGETFFEWVISSMQTS